MVRQLLRLWLGLLIAFAGCNTFQSEKSDPESLLSEPTETSSTKLVGDLARTWGLKSAKIQGIALVTNLAGTGGDPDPSATRNLLMEDMKRYKVDSPGNLLASNSTSLVIVEATLPPAVRKGDRIDVEVQTPNGSRTTSLENGWLMNCRLQDMQVLGNQIRSGRVLALAQGPILPNSKTDGEVNKTSATRGRILGGGAATKSRNLGLVLAEENHHVSISRRIGIAVNRRFFHYDRGNKVGVANPKQDNFIELAIQPQYRNNLLRYVRVVEAIAINETSAKQMDRMNQLREELLDPETSVQAALQLEAIGHEAAQVLLSGIESSDPLVRFYSAEALAYLNHEAAVKILEVAALNESSLRWRALTALSAMTKLNAHDSLSNLLHAESAETRYGAFQALQEAHPSDPLIRGQNLNDVLALHEIASHAQPMVHIRKTKRPEVVIFGSDVRLTPPLLVSAGSSILVKSQGGDQIKVTRFDATSSQSDFCTNNLADVIRTIVGVGGSYSDAVAAINEAKGENQNGCLKARVAVEALPRNGRKFTRDSEELGEDEDLNQVEESDESPTP